MPYSRQRRIEFGEFNTVKVQLRTFGIFNQPLTLTFPGESLPIKAFLNHLPTLKELNGILTSEGLKPGFILFINGVRSDLAESPLKDGDVVTILLPLSGG